MGEVLTQETQSWWPLSWTVYLHWARVFQSLIVLSLAAETICLLLAESARENIFAWNPRTCLGLQTEQEPSYCWPTYTLFNITKVPYGGIRFVDHPFQQILQMVSNEPTVILVGRGRDPADKNECLDQP